MANENEKPAPFITSHKTRHHWQVVAKGIPIGANLTAEDLWNGAIDYFRWCDSNPVYKQVLIRAGMMAGLTASEAVDRPYTVSGLCLHLGITRDYLYTTARSEVQNDFYFVCNKILEIIHTQVLEYSITGVYSSLVSSLVLGLKSNREDDKASPIINITIEGNSPPLLKSEYGTELLKLEDSK